MLIFWILFFVSFLGTYYVMPHSIRKLRENGYVVKDRYKLGKPLIPTNAGIIILFISYISIALLPLIVRFLNLLIPIEHNIYDLSFENMAFLLVISIYALYGLVDDLVDIGRKLKFLLPVIFGYPLISITSPEIIWIPILGNFDLMSNVLGEITWNDLFKVIVIPVYVMVVANLTNMHSGYNGLQSGLSIILLFTLLFKAWVDGGSPEKILPGSAILGSMVAFWLFNRYPSRIFEGNIGSLLLGSTIGCAIVIQEFWWFGFFILIPHTFNFLLWLYWLGLMKKSPDIYLDSLNRHEKFGFLSDSNNLKVPNLLTLKWFPNYFLGSNEKESVRIMYLITLSFCVVGVVIF